MWGFVWPQLEEASLDRRLLQMLTHKCGREIVLFVCPPPPQQHLAYPWCLKFWNQSFFFREILKMDLKMQWAQTKPRTFQPLTIEFDLILQRRVHIYDRFLYFLKQRLRRPRTHPRRFIPHGGVEEGWSRREASSFGPLRPCCQHLLPWKIPESEMYVNPHLSSPHIWMCAAWTPPPPPLQERGPHPDQIRVMEANEKTRVPDGHSEMDVLPEVYLWYHPRLWTQIYYPLKSGALKTACLSSWGVLVGMKWDERPTHCWQRAAAVRSNNFNAIKS